jgi:hypothetical protein
MEKDFDMKIDLEYGFSKHERSFNMKTGVKRVREKNYVKWLSNS